MTPDRRILHCRISAEAHETWTAFSASNGITITGLVEAIAIEYAAHLNGGEVDTHPTAFRVLERARAVDASRRRRGSDGS